eukprot:COSAG01_NODE_10237_length_2212_cov_26.025083_2_plen_184_part_00
MRRSVPDSENQLSSQPGQPPPRTMHAPPPRRRDSACLPYFWGVSRPAALNLRAFRAWPVPGQPHARARAPCMPAAWPADFPTRIRPAAFEPRPTEEQQQLPSVLLTVVMMLLLPTSSVLPMMSLSREPPVRRTAAAVGRTGGVRVIERDGTVFSMCPIVVYGCCWGLTWPGRFPRPSRQKCVI